MPLQTTFDQEIQQIFKISLYDQDIRPHMSMDVGKRRLRALIDSGASISVIDDALLKKCEDENWEVINKTPHLAVKVASGEHLKILMNIRLKFTMCGREMYHKFTVVSGLHRNKIILGYDFMKKKQIGLQDEFLTFQGEKWKLAQNNTEVKIAEVTELSDGHGKQITFSLSVESGTKILKLKNEDIAIIEVSNFKTSLIFDESAQIDMKDEEIIGCVEDIEDYHFIYEDEWEQIEAISASTDIFGAFNEIPPIPPRGRLHTTTEDHRNKIKDKLRLDIASDYWRQKYQDLIMDYADVFSKDKYDMGMADVIEHSIRVKNPNEVVYTRQFPIPIAHQKIIQDYSDGLLRQGILEPSKSQHNSPIFAVPKKILNNGRDHDPTNLRVVQDFRKLNEQSMDDSYEIQDVRSLIDEIGLNESDTFSTIDLTSGFWQMSLEPESRPYTAFTVPGKDVKYQWKRMAMGLKGASASFSKLINCTLTGLKGVLTYIDDVMVHAKGDEDQLRILEDVFMRMRQFDLKINPNKSEFGKKDCSYLGFEISKNGIRPSKDKTAAIKKAKYPTTLKEVRSFLGLINYFRNMIPKFTEKTEPLMALTRSKSSWKSGSELPNEAKKAFDDLKEVLCSEPILALPKRNMKYILTTDASTGSKEQNIKGGMGAVLSQIQDNEKEVIISYASRTLKTHEENYSPYLAEMGAAIFGIEYFHVYLIGRKFTLRMDHKPLETMKTIHKKTLNRLQMAMLTYNFDIVYKEGKSNVVADFLSRNALVASMKIDEFKDINIAEEQMKEVIFSDIRTYVTTGRLPEKHTESYARWMTTHAPDCFLEDNVLWMTLRRKGMKDRTVLLLPQTYREEVIKAAHMDFVMGHASANKTSERILMRYWWPGAQNQVQNYVKRCLRCQEISGKKTMPVPWQSLPITASFNDRIHVDLFGPLRTDQQGKKYVMVMTDAFSKWVRLATIPNKEAETVAAAFFENWIVPHSCPHLLISDNGREFCNQILDALTTKFKIKRGTTTSGHPEANAHVETFNKTMKRYLKAVLNNDQTLLWEEQLGPLMLAYNTAVHRTTLETPFFLTYGMEARLPYFDLDDKQKIMGEDLASEKFIAFKKVREMVKDNEEAAQQARRIYYEDKTKQRDFKPGDKVMLFDPQLKNRRQTNAKFIKPWTIYYVVEIINQSNVCIQKTPHSKAVKVHVNRLRHVWEREDSVVPEQCKGQDQELQNQRGFCTENQNNQQKASPLEVNQEDNKTGIYARTRSKTK